ncbi:uncharacterized protein LOC135339061 isoform X1 [Halichondria panicea]|uniref:uncharacterized protein LOC135339061 isoform X1 n=1 Tax=Halichondria panicea TaxID=6063 RepID=UPI00312B4ED3
MLPTKIITAAGRAVIANSSRIIKSMRPSGSRIIKSMRPSGPVIRPSVPRPTVLPIPYPSRIGPIIVEVPENLLGAGKSVSLWPCLCSSTCKSIHTVLLAVGLAIFTGIIVYKSRNRDDNI